MKTPATQFLAEHGVSYEDGKPLIVLMHGDRKVSTKELAGYQVGGTSPFGTRKSLPVFIERSVLDLPAMYINGGRREFLLRIAPGDLVKLLKPTPVDVARS